MTVLAYSACDATVLVYIAQCVKVRKSLAVVNAVQISIHCLNCLVGGLVCLLWGGSVTLVGLGQGGWVGSPEFHGWVEMG